MNINTKSYWDNRFASGDWEAKQGRVQTRHFAESQVNLLGVEPQFRGTLLDFGCGLGDAMPVYRRAFPKARLIGVDISTAGVERCRQRYGHLAEFIACDHTAVPCSDVTIASNVFEHLTNDEEVAAQLLTTCKRLFIIAPYRESLKPGAEHINQYDEHSFSRLSCRQHTIFAARGWSAFGRHLWYDIRFKNIIRRMLGRPTVQRSMQIMFEFAYTYAPEVNEPRAVVIAGAMYPFKMPSDG